jgi:hypothetical protein
VYHVRVHMQGGPFAIDQNNDSIISLSGIQ